MKIEPDRESTNRALAGTAYARPWRIKPARTIAMDEWRMALAARNPVARSMFTPFRVDENTSSPARDSRPFREKSDNGKCGEMRANANPCAAAPRCGSLRACSGMRGCIPTEEGGIFTGEKLRTDAFLVYDQCKLKKPSSLGLTTAVIPVSGPTGEGGFDGIHFQAEWQYLGFSSPCHWRGSIRKQKSKGKTMDSGFRRNDDQNRSASKGQAATPDGLKGLSATHPLLGCLHSPNREIRAFSTIP